MRRPRTRLTNSTLFLFSFFVECKKKRNENAFDDDVVPISRRWLFRDTAREEKQRGISNSRGNSPRINPVTRSIEYPRDYRGVITGREESRAG